MSLGINYQGSKRKIAGEIVDFLRKRNPSATTFIDLFGGGGAVTCAAVKAFDRVIYNEKNPAIFELFKLCTTEPLPHSFYKWYSREEFEARRAEPNAMGGYLSANWSFGGNQRTYLYGRDIEESKRLAHEVVVNRCAASALALGIDASQIFDLQEMHARRIAFYQIVKGRADLQHLQHLERLERLQRLERLEFSCGSYAEFAFPHDMSKVVVYCDPPYAGTSQYADAFNSEAFCDWVEEVPFKVYVSEYEMRLPLVHQIKHRSSLSADNNAKQVLENIYCNRPEIRLYEELF